MKKKMVGILVCMLLIVTAFSVNGCVELNDIKSNISIDKGIASSSTTADYKSFFNRHKEGESNILNKNGNWQWAKRAGGTDYDVGAAITTLSDNSIIVTGSFSGSATFGPGESSETVLVSDGSGDIFVAKHNPDGTIAWAKRAGGTDYDFGNGVSVDGNGNTYITGSFKATADFGPYNLTSQGDSDVFVAKLSGENQPPIANFTFTPLLPDVGETISFTDTSIDPDGIIVNYTWYFGGSVSYEMNPTHQYNNSGCYPVMLEVTDDDGDMDTVAKLVLVDFQMMPISIVSSGWNFISAPYNFTQDSGEFIIKHGDYYYNWTYATTDLNPTSSPLINSYMFGWNRTLQTYTFETNLEPGYGCWMYAYQPVEIWIQEDTAPVDDNITDLEQGWNIVGVPHDQPIVKTDILVNNIPWADAVTAGIISDYVFGWNRVTQSYTFADTFMPGYGYWMYAYQPCTLKRGV